MIRGGLVSTGLTAAQRAAVVVSAAQGCRPSDVLTTVDDLPPEPPEGLAPGLSALIRRWVEDDVRLLPLLRDPRVELVESWRTRERGLDLELELRKAMHHEMTARGDTEAAEAALGLLTRLVRRRLRGTAHRISDLRADVLLPGLAGQSPAMARRARARRPRRRAATRRAAGIRAGTDPGESDPAPNTPTLTVLPRPPAIYAFACLTAEQRGELDS
jgi:hypothetical protein